MAGSACTDEMGPRPDAELAEADSLRLGRIHVVIEPEDDSLEDTTDALEVTARFAFVRGLEEDFVRARIDMPILPHDFLRPSDCGVSDQLAATSAAELEPAEPRELALVDAGDLTIVMADSRIEIPLSLVPDLLPYMSGVEYVYYGDAVPTLPVEDAGLTVEAQGAPNSELPSFSVDGRVPDAVELVVTDEDLQELAENALVLRWSSGAEPTVTVRLTPLLGGEPVGDELTCVLPDEGASRLDLGKLRALGLPSTADALRVEASRLSTGTFDVGEFIGSELVVERRDRITVPLR